MAYSYYSQNIELSKYRDDNISIVKALTNIGLIYSYRSLEEDLSDDSIAFLHDKPEAYMNSALFTNKVTNRRLELLRYYSSIECCKNATS
jgi:hypothetical protein